jgi:hypothetical protein
LPVCIESIRFHKERQNRDWAGNSQRQLNYNNYKTTLVDLDLVKKPNPACNRGVGGYFLIPFSGKVSEVCPGFRGRVSDGWAETLPFVVP